MSFSFGIGSSLATNEDLAAVVGYLHLHSLDTNLDMIVKGISI